MNHPPLRYSLRQLKYFVTTAETLSFTAAAKLLHISQPSVSSSLSELEAAFGVQLFIRHHAQGLSLTQAGRDLLGRARDLLKNAEELELSARSSGETIAGPVSLGCLTSLAPPLMPRLLSAFLDEYADVEFRTLESNQQDLLDGLHDGSLDIALTYEIDLSDDIEFTPIMAFAPYVLLPAKHPLAQHPTVSLKNLLNEPYVMLDLAHSREYFASLFENLGSRPTPAFRSSQPEVVRGMVANGLGYSIHNFPLLHTQTVDGKKFVATPISDPVKAAVLGIARSRHLKARRVVKEFEDFCVVAIEQIFSQKTVPTTIEAISPPVWVNA